MPDLVQSPGYAHCAMPHRDHRPARALQAALAGVGQAVSLLVLAPFAFVLFKRWTFRLRSA